MPPSKSLIPLPTDKKYRALRKIDRPKVQALAHLGVIPSDIAQHQGVAVSTITRYLAQVGIVAGQISEYCSKRADALALSQLKLQTISDVIISRWADNPELLTSLDMRLQKEILVAVQGAKTYEYTTERLERGQSTDNIAVIGMIKQLQELDRGVDNPVDNPVDNST